MKIGKITLASIAITVFVIIVAMLTCGSTFNWVYQLNPTNVWKPMVNGIDPLYYLAEFVASLLFVLVYVILQKGIPGSNKYTKGLVYGLAVFSVGMLPGMFATYFFQVINPIVIIYWTIWGLIVTPLKGVIASAICSE